LAKRTRQNSRRRDILKNERGFGNSRSPLQSNYHTDIEIDAIRQKIADKRTKLLSKENARDAIDRYKSESVSGVLEGNAKGFAFLRLEDSDDIFIPARKMSGAMHGDKVLVRASKYNGRVEGEVVSILERAPDIVGKISIQRGLCFVTPLDSRIARQIDIDRSSTNNAIDGDTVVVKLETSTSNHLYGKVVEVLGSEGDIGVDVLAIIRSFGLRENFDKKTTQEAQQLPKTVSSQQLERRFDFREKLVVTIDGDDTKDIDDAVSVVATGYGWNLSVHIADVAEYVLQGSALDKEAFRRGTSVYFADRVLPMLPRELSNGICSLNPMVDRLTVSLIMDIDKNGNVLNAEIIEGIVKCIQLTYFKVSAVLQGGIDVLRQLNLQGVGSNIHQLYEMILEMDKLRAVLHKKRMDNGSIDFDLPESKIIIDGQGRAVDVKRAERDNSNRIIEEFMLVANQTIAKKFYELKVPFVYRVHQKPDSKKIESLNDFVTSLGYVLKGNHENISSMDIRRLVESVDARHQKAINTVALRSMMKASYEADSQGHFGLAFEYYTHFTSPIRRYPDLAIHRIIKEYLKADVKGTKKYKGWVNEVAKQSSKCERLAEEAERKVDDLKKCEYAKDHIGESHTGTISGIIERGIFVELPNTIEGMIKVENLGGTFVYEPKSFKLIGNKTTYSIGDEIQITIYAVDSVNNKIEFVTPDFDKIKKNQKSSKNIKSRSQNYSKKRKKR